MSQIDVLFVCTANICRSPFMELYAAARSTSPDVAFSSAGTHGFHQHAMDRTMRRQLQARDLDANGFRSRRLTRELLESADLVLTAELDHRAFILAEHPAFFRRVYTLGQFVVAASSNEPMPGRDLVTRLTTTGERPVTSPEVLDPYGRGTRAAAACAEQIVELVDSALLALER